MILIIDDDAAVRSSLTFLLKHAGYETKAVITPKEALDFVRSYEPDLILMDMNFSLGTSGEEGIQLLRQVKIFHPDIPVILMTAWGSISLAVEGMKYGAFDFITKPWNNLMLLNIISTALELNEQKKEKYIAFNRVEADERSFFHKIIGKSAPIMDILNTVSRISPTNASVLITGESGTGKELIAEAIHANSSRVQNPFIKVNLGGLSHSLFESEMFGHKKGSFTDAHLDRTGRFELANNGTIFLDEIGDLDLSCQVKLLRVLQDQTFEVLGDSTPKKTNIRVVSATNRNLSQMVINKTFREDLFYRINLITIHLPPLRERIEDIPLLAQYFANQITNTNKLPPVKFTTDAISYLQSLPYPGNIRELKNLIERTLLVSGKNILTKSDFSQLNNLMPTLNNKNQLDELTLEELEKKSIEQAMEKYSGNISKIASVLGISRAALYRRMEKYGIKNEGNIK